MMTKTISLALLALLLLACAHGKTDNFPTVATGVGAVTANVTLIKELYD